MRKEKGWTGSYGYSVWEFKPTLWQKIKLFFAPVYVGVDIADGVSVTVTAKRIDGKIIITDIVSDK